MNLDGFRKIVGTDQGGLKADKDDWQFQNVNFIRSQPRLLENVKRKVAIICDVCPSMDRQLS